MYCSPNIVGVIKWRIMIWEWQVERMGRCFVGKPGGKRPLGRPRRIWKNNIAMDRQEVGCGGMDWIELAHRWRGLVNAVMNLRVL